MTFTRQLATWDIHDDPTLGATAGRLLQLWSCVHAIYGAHKSHPQLISIQQLNSTRHSLRTARDIFRSADDTDVRNLFWWKLGDTILWSCPDSWAAQILLVTVESVLWLLLLILISRTKAQEKIQYKKWECKCVRELKTNKYILSLSDFHYSFWRMKQQIKYFQ